MKIVTALEEAITSIGWPFVQLGDTKTQTDTAKSVSIQDLQELVRCLIQISEDQDNHQDCEQDREHHGACERA